MARPAKPTALKLAAENPGKRPINHREPKPTGGPSAPTSMSAAAKKIWTSVNAAMPAGVYTNADTFTLAAYCEAVARHQYATKMLEKGPKEVQGSTGQIKLSPWFAEASESARLMATLGGKLGLDPVARQSIDTGISGGQASQFDGLIN